MRRFLLVACLALVFTVPARAGLNHWTTGGPFGGTVEELAFDPGDPGVVYAGTFGGVYRSEDHGATWTSASFGLTDAYIADLEVAPGSPGPLYAATFKGVQRSDDGGRTWQTPTLIGFVRALALAPSNPQTLYAAIGRATYKSTDGGASWTPGATLPGSGDTFLKVDPLLPSHVYAGTSKDLYFSQDAGSTFVPVLGLHADSLYGVAIDPTNTQILYAATSDGVFKTTNHGQTWAPSGLTEEVRAVVIDPASPSTLLALGFFEVYRSTNAGGSWTSVLEDHFVNHAIAFDPSSASNYLLGTSSGIYRSTNGGGAWLPSNTGLTATTATQVTVDPHRPGVLYTLVGLSDLYKSTDAGATWSRLGGISGVRTFALDPKTPSLLYAATNQGFLRSQNGGATWVLINADQAGGNWIAIDPQTPSTLYMSRFPGGISKSLNGGITWSPASPGGEGFAPRIVMIVPSAPQTLFASDFDSGLYKSTDGGATWALLDIDGLEEQAINTLAIDPKNANVIYAAVQNELLYKSVNGGATWSFSGNGIPFFNVEGIAIDPFQTSRLYATSFGGGIVRSTDAGATWLPFNDGRLAGLEMGDIVLDPVNPHLLYASSAGGGVLARAELQASDSLQLNGNRFRVKMGWAAQGNAGPGFTKPLTGDTGYAFFFSESNVEVMLKVLDACGFNGHFWVFAAGLTNVRTDITVADSVTGAVKIYHSPAGEAFQPIQDTSALACGGGTAFAASKELSTAAAEPVLLKGGRFRVTAEFVTAPGATPLPTQGALLTDDTGYLWFFNQSNVEVLIKVVDGCALNDRFWIFAAGLTDVEMRITVEDTKTGASKVYENTRGTAFRPVQDTSAFEGCGGIP
ncbi:MAG TPA: hypothetical protein VF179_07985 [Thermoanaerobaculia bacterium]|nr:hypothetical protein [Thermoanaerobaculia bacterium]